MQRLTTATAATEALRFSCLAARSSSSYSSSSSPRYSRSRCYSASNLRPPPSVPSHRQFPHPRGFRRLATSASPSPPQGKSSRDNDDESAAAADGASPPAPAAPAPSAAPAAEPESEEDRQRRRRERLWNNMFKDGTVGQRGEEFVALQVICFAGVALPPDALLALLLPFYSPSLFDAADVAYLNWLVGAGLVAAGGWFSSAAVKDLGENLSPFPKPPSDGELETGGMYSVVRHPIYSGVVLLALGLTLLTGSTGRAVMTAVLVAMFDQKSKLEERFLVDKFGERYKEYQARVKKLVPFVY